jgi:hypothetical protein
MSRETTVGVKITSHQSFRTRAPILARDRTAMPITSFALCAIVIVVLVPTMKNARQ